MSTIFISHSSVDNALAKELLDWLKSQGYQSVFLDLHPDEGIGAGEHWEQVLYRELVSCSVVIALVTEDWSASKWCFAEATHARSGGKTIFGLTPNRSVPPAILSDTQLIDYSPENRTDAYQRLVDVLSRAIDPQALGRWDPTRPLYPGLLFFDEQDAPIFFGRRRLGRAIYQKLRELRAKPPGSERLLLVFGPSGCGKSSLVRAGTLPHVRANPAEWITLGPFRPTEGWPEPLRNSLNVLSGADEQTAVTRLSEIAKQLRREADTPKAAILLIIDQLEEAMDTRGGSEMSFWLPLSRLLEPNDTPFMAMATLRSDFMGDFQEWSGKSAVRFGSFPVEPMALEDLREVIVGPGRVVGITIEPGLVDALVDDAGNEQALPLLALVLNRLWLRYEDKQGGFTVSDYRDGLGGMFGLIDREAENALRGKGLNERVVLDAFLGLTRLVREGVIARQPAVWDTLQPEARKSLEPFVAARLLVRSSVEDEQTDGSSAKETVVVDHVHEALLAGWKRLREWLGRSENRDFLIWREELRHKAGRWARSQDGKGSLLEGADLAEAKKWLKAKRVALNSQEESYIQAGIDAKKISRKKIVIALTVLLIAVAGAWGWTRTDHYQIQAIERAVPGLVRVSAASGSSESRSDSIRSLKQMAVSDYSDLALVAAEEIDNASTKAKAFREIAKAHAEAGQTEQALAVANQFGDATSRSEAIREIAKVFAEAGQTEQSVHTLEQALAVANQIDDVSSKAMAIREIGKALAAAGQSEQSVHTLEQALAVANQIDDVSSKARATREIGEAFAAAGQSEQSVHALEQALTAANQISDATSKARAIREIGKVLAEAGQTEQSVRAFEQALLAANQIGDAASKAMAIRKIGKVLAEAGQTEQSVRAFEQALLAANQIGDAAGREYVIREIAKAFAEAIQSEQSVRAFEQALAVANQIDDVSSKAMAIREIAKALAAAIQTEQTVHAFEQALIAANQIGDAISKAWAIREIAKALAEAGQTEQAVRAFEQALLAANQIGNSSSKARTIREIAKALAEAGQTEQAIRAFKQALSVANQIRDVSSRARAIREIGKVLAEAGQTEQSVHAFEQALLAANQIANSSSKARTIREIAKALAEAGQTEQTVRAFEQALLAANQIGDATSKAEAIREIAKALVEAGQTEQAVRAFEQALAVANHIGNIFTRARIIREIDKAFAPAGQSEQAVRAFNQALAVANQIGDVSSRARAIREIGKVLAEAGQTEKSVRAFEQALLAANQIGDAASKAEAIREIGKALGAAGQTEQCFRALEQALTVANQIGNSSSKARTIREIAKALAVVAQTEQAVIVIEQVVPALDWIETESFKVDTFWVIARTIAEARPLNKEMLDEARQIAKNISNLKAQSVFYSLIASEYGRLGEYRPARLTAAMAKVPKDTLYAYVAILKYYAIEKDPELAKKLAKLEKQKKD